MWMLTCILVESNLATKKRVSTKCTKTILFFTLTKNPIIPKWSTQNTSFPNFFPLVALLTISSLTTCDIVVYRKRKAAVDLGIENHHPMVEQMYNIEGGGSYQPANLHGGGILQVILQWWTSSKSTTKPNIKAFQTTFFVNRKIMFDFQQILGKKENRKRKCERKIKNTFQL